LDKEKAPEAASRLCYATAASPERLAAAGAGIGGIGEIAIGS